MSAELRVGRGGLIKMAAKFTYNTITPGLLDRDPIKMAPKLGFITHYSPGLCSLCFDSFYIVHDTFLPPRVILALKFA